MQGARRKDGWGKDSGAGVALAGTGRLLQGSLQEIAASVGSWQPAPPYMRWLRPLAEWGPRIALHRRWCSGKQNTPVGQLLCGGGTNTERLLACSLAAIRFWSSFELIGWTLNQVTSGSGEAVWLLDSPRVAVSVELHNPACALQAEESGVLGQVVRQVRQVFERFNCDTPAQGPDERFKFFT